MKKYIYISLIFFVSCASMGEKLKGYTTHQIREMSELKGKTPTEVISILGEPVAQGNCSGVYKVVYLEKETPRYSFALDIANESTTLRCTVLRFNKNQEGEWVNQIHGPISFSSCGSKRGTIQNTRKCPKS